MAALASLLHCSHEAVRGARLRTRGARAMLARSGAPFARRESDRACVLIVRAYMMHVRACVLIVRAYMMHVRAYVLIVRAYIMHVRGVYIV